MWGNRTRTKSCRNFYYYNTYDLFAMFGSPTFFGILLSFSSHMRSLASIFSETFPSPHTFTQRCMQCSLLLLLRSENRQERLIGEEADRVVRDDLDDIREYALVEAGGTFLRQYRCDAVEHACVPARTRREGGREGAKTVSSRGKGTEHGECVWRRLERERERERHGDASLPPRAASAGGGVRG